MAAAPTLKRALSAFSSEDISREEALRWLWLASATAVRVWDDESWDLLSRRQVELAREAGALGVLPLALNQRTGMHLHDGDLAAAASAMEVAQAITEATGSQLPPYASLAPTGSPSAPGASCSPPASASPTAPLIPRPAHRPGHSDRPAGPRRAVQPRHRGPAVHDRTHGPAAPAQGLHQA